MKEAASKTKGLYLLAGSDHYAVQKAALALTAKLAPEDPMNFEVIDAQVENVEGALRQISELKAAVLTLPFMGGGKLIWWKNVNFLNDDVQGRSPSVLEALEALLPALDAVDGQSVTLVISALGVDRRRSFYKQLGKLGDVQALDLPDARKMTPEEIIEKVERAVLASGLKLESEIIERLAQTCGLNPRALDQTVQKLVTAAGTEKKLSTEEARWLVKGEEEGVIWDYCDAVLRGRPRVALDELAQLLRQGDSEVGILILLGQQIRLAALAAVLAEHKLLKLSTRGSFVNAEVKPEAEVYLPRKKSGETVNLWQLGQVAQKSQSRPSRFWLRAVDKVYQLNLQLVTGVVEKERALELLTLELAAGT